MDKGIRRGSVVQFLKQKNYQRNAMVQWFRERFGKGPYKVVEVVDHKWIKLEPCSDISFTHHWFAVR